MLTLMQVIPKVLLLHDTAAADILKLESLVADVEHVLIYFHYYKYEYMYGDWLMRIATSISFACWEDIDIVGMKFQVKKAGVNVAEFILQSENDLENGVMKASAYLTLL